MITQDRRNNAPGNINGEKINFLERMLQADTPPRSPNVNYGNSNRNTGLLTDLYVPCPRRPHETQKGFLPSSQKCSSNQVEEEDNGEVPEARNVNALSPLNACSIRGTLNESLEDSLQTGSRMVITGAPQDTSYKSNSASSYYSPMVYESSLNTCTSSPNGRDVGAESCNKVQAGFNGRGTATRSTNAESDYKELDGLSKCTQRHACKHKDCGKSFTTSAHLSRHVKLHTGQRPHKCPLPGCKKEFARRDNMLVHYRTHAKKSGVEFGITVVGARRASSGSIPQGCKHMLNVSASIGRLGTDENEVGFPVMRALQSSREESYPLGARLYQYGDMGLVGSQQGPLRVGQCHPYPPCQYAPPLVQGENSDPSKNNSISQLPLSNPGSPYDEGVFNSQAYGGLREVPIDASMHGNLKLALQKYPRKQVCQHGQQQIGFSRQRSHSETPSLCNSIRSQSGVNYKPFHLHFSYPMLEERFFGHKITNQESEPLAAPAYFGTPEPRQKAQDAQSYYTGGKIALEQVNANPNTADPMPALIKSLIKGDNSSNIEIKVNL